MTDSLVNEYKNKSEQATPTENHWSEQNSDDLDNGIYISHNYERERTQFHSWTSLITTTQVGEGISS